MTKPPHQRPPPTPRTWRRSALRILACAPLLTSGWAAAQAPGCGGVCERYGSLLQAPERDLIGSIRTLEKVARPAMGPRNTRGRWIQRSAYLGAEAFDTTFYLKSGIIQRIEMVSTAPDVQCRTRTPWSTVIATLETWQGQGAVTGQFTTDDNIQQSVHWATGDLDLSVYLSVSTQACATTVTFKAREVKDASAL